MQGIVEYLKVWDLVQDTVLNDEEDRLVWRWSSDGTYSSRLAYWVLFLPTYPAADFDRTWATWAPLRVKIFLWLALRKRHWTADRRQRHGLDAAEYCYLCDQEAEPIDHIITSCSFSRQVWFTMLVVLGATTNDVGAGTTLQWWDSWRNRWTGEKKIGAD